MLFHAADDHYEFVPIAAVMSVLSGMASGRRSCCRVSSCRCSPSIDELPPTPLAMIVSDRAGALPVVLRSPDGAGV